MRPRTLSAILVLGALLPVLADNEPAKIRLLFLGDSGHHQPALRFRQLQPVLAAHGIELTYADTVEALNAKTLAAHDGLVIYANHNKLAPEQEQALLDFVAGGKGLVALHCASACFGNSAKYIELIGAQFKSHASGTFRSTVAAPDHPVMKGYHGFESWDETYVHQKHNEKDRTVLEFREDPAGKEPWTWVRTHGKGRVFYTAWGHDARTWGNPGFHNLVERGIRWAVGRDPGAVAPFTGQVPQMTPKRTDIKPFEYVDANIPFYPPGKDWGTLTEGPRKMQKPVPAEESLKHIVHPTDFEVKLFADESLLGGKPICMTWDERGRLWVALTMDYPNELKPEGEGRDRIVILEDTKGTGRADKVTVFADKLSIPTSLAFWKGGVVVHQAPHTLYLKDTDGDDKADERKVLFTGWGTSDTHAGPSNLRYGLDNWVYGIVGYSGFNGEVGGEKHNFRQGFYRFRPDGTKLEFLRNTNNNSWGLGFSEEGLLFGSTANGNPSVYMPIPNRYYESVRGWSSTVLGGIAGSPKMEVITDKVRQVDWHGQFTAAAGHALYTARTYPRQYWNRTAFVCEPTGHIAATFVIDRDGTDFRSRNAWNLMASDDEWTAPIMAEVGPDGNVWVIDWYNYIVQHNPTPKGFKTGKGNAFETELRDKKHGRIYRLVAKNAKSVPPITLKDATPEKLVSTLKHDNMFWRLQAQRLLVERGKKDVVPALIALVNEPGVDEIGLNVGAIHALWTLHGLGELNEVTSDATAAALRALDHKSAGVRRNAVLVLPRVSGVAAVLVRSNVIEDADPQVRLATVLTLAEIPQYDLAGLPLARMLVRQENVNDRWIPDAITSAAAAHPRAFFLYLAKQEKTPESPRAVQIVGTVAEHYARGETKSYDPQVLKAFIAADPKIAAAVVAGLAKGWPKDRKLSLSADDEQALRQLLDRLPSGAKGQLLRLAATWGSKQFETSAAEIARSLLAIVTSDKETDEHRLDAARQLVEFRAEDVKVVEKLLEIVTPRLSPALAEGIVQALAASQTSAAGRTILGKIDTLPPQARKAALGILLGRPDTARLLLDAIEKGQVQFAELSLDQKQALAAHPDRQIAGRAKKLLQRGGGLPNPDREKVVAQLMPLTERKGDAAAGKAVFKQHCMKCHMHSGEGNKIGPDLTGMSVHPKSHLLIDIIDPSRSVEGNFKLYVLETKDGRLLNGLLASETKTSVEIVDAEAKKHVVQRDNIESLTASPKSLMPDGFEKQMPEADLVNLLEFLTQRGKFVPLPLAKAATIVSTLGMFHSKDAAVERLVFDDWSPKTVEGVPFQLVDPRGDRVPNVILLHGPQGKVSAEMPKAARLACNGPAKAIHLLSGVSGWGHPLGDKGSVSMIVKLHYADGQTEEHPLRNGEHFADYIRRVDVPGSKFAFDLKGRQVRYLAVRPKRSEPIKDIEFVKGPDNTAPVVMAVTVESAE